MEVVVIGLGRPVLFYGQQLLGEGLSLGEARDAAFTLSKVIIWVGKQSQLETKPVSLGDGWQLIAQAITERHIEHSGPGYPCSTTPASTSFNFCNPNLSPWCTNLQPVVEQWEMPQLASWKVPQEWGWPPQLGQNRDQRQQELWVAPPQLPSLSSNHWFKSDRSTVSTSSSMSSISDRSGGSRHAP